MKTPNKVQIENNNFFAGQFNQFVEQEARLYIRDAFLSDQGNTTTESLAQSLASMIRNDPQNFTSVLFNGTHFASSNASKERFADIAVKTIPPSMSVKGNYLSNDSNRIVSQINWDFSASVNSKVAAMVTDYLMNRESKTVDVEEIGRFIEKHIVEPIEQHQQLQREIPARLIALQEVHTSLMNRVDGDFEQRYCDALTTDSMDLKSIQLIEVDASKQCIVMPKEFAQLKAGLTEINDMGLSDEAGRLSLPSTSQELQHIFDREGLDIVSQPLTNQVHEHLERFKCVASNSIEKPIDDFNVHQP